MLPVVHQHTCGSSHLGHCPFQALESAQCSIQMEGLGKKKRRIHAKKKKKEEAWLLEIPSSWSIFHLLSLNCFLSARVDRYHRSLPEFGVVQYFKTHRFP